MCALAVDASARLDSHELSSLCLGAGGELLGVGDSSFRIVRGVTGPLRASTRSASLRELVADRSDDPEKGSQWEGIAVDGAGLAFVLQEHAGRERPSHVFVFSPGHDALAGVIELHVPEGEERWRRSWREAPNARGEAVLLLAQGHLLVAKQADPIGLIEFGPPGRPALGPWSGRPAGEHLPSGGPFVLRYEPLAAWLLEPGREPPLASVNDVAVADGELYVVSRSSRRIARLRAGSPSADALEVAASWDLPRAIENPEGLVFLADSSPVVADDQPKRRRDRDNVFKLEPLPRGD